jgi:hypothetical protein
MAKKSWKEKLENKKDQLPELKEIDCEKLIDKVGRGKMLIPAPLEINYLMKTPSEGEIIDSEQMREYFAEKYEAVYVCPMCTGIFTNIAAHAALEAKEMGENDITPYWRTLKSKGEINPKFPGGLEAQIEALESEGHEIIRKGSKAFVKDYLLKRRAL